MKVARERIDSTLELDESAMRTMQSKRSQPRIPFGTLVEMGMIAPGAVLTDSKRRWEARVRADASVEMSGKQGSIHQMGAAVQGAPSCNGWTFWHLRQGDRLVPLDELRQSLILAQE